MYGTNFHLENQPKESLDMDKASQRYYPICDQMTCLLEALAHPVEMGLEEVTINLLTIQMLYTLAVDIHRIQD